MYLAMSENCCWQNCDELLNIRNIYHTRRWRVTMIWYWACNNATENYLHIAYLFLMVNKNLLVMLVLHRCHQNFLLFVHCFGRQCVRQCICANLSSTNAGHIIFFRTANIFCHNTGNMCLTICSDELLDVHQHLSLSKKLVNVTKRINMNIFSMFTFHL